MPVNRLRLVFTLALVFCGRAACAAASPADALYLGGGRVLEPETPRQLSLNADVREFLFQPGGLSLAYLSAPDNRDGKNPPSVLFVDARSHTPTTRTLFTAGVIPSDPAGEVPDISLIGWSRSGRYLLLRLLDETNHRMQLCSVDVGKEPFEVRDVTVPTVAGNDYSLPEMAWSPNRQRLLIVLSAPTPGQRDVSAAAVYDPDAGTEQDVSVAQGYTIIGWLDDWRLLLFSSVASRAAPSAYDAIDLTAQTDRHTPRPIDWPPAGEKQILLTEIPNNTQAAPPGLALETTSKTLTDSEGVSGMPARAIWIRRAGAPKAMAVAGIDITPDDNDPQAAWSPTGKAVAYISRGDLFVADIDERDATASEKTAAGEKLNCEDERQIITSNLKQVGLAMMMYCEDNDEQYPAADKWRDALSPYAKDDSLFNYAGVPVVYHAPAHRAMADMEAPAATVLATADLPCARVVLYADGHVKTYDKNGDLIAR